MKEDIRLVEIQLSEENSEIIDALIASRNKEENIDSVEVSLYMGKGKRPLKIILRPKDDSVDFDHRQRLAAALCPHPAAQRPVERHSNQGVAGHRLPGRVHHHRHLLHLPVGHPAPRANSGHGLLLPLPPTAGSDMDIS